MKVLVAGGRDFTNAEAIIHFINDLMAEGKLPEDTPLELVCGMAQGADITAYHVFKNNGLTIHEFPADWKDMSEPCIRKVNKYGAYNALAGMKRNTEMSEVAEVLIAFWDGVSKGTKDMINKMQALGKPVYICRY